MSQVIKLHKAPAINKGLDVVMAYPVANYG